MPKLPKNIGWSMGTELRESQYVLSAKNSAPVQRGMIFHVSLGILPALLSIWLKPYFHVSICAQLALLSLCMKLCCKGTRSSSLAPSASQVLHHQRWRKSTSWRCAVNATTDQAIESLKGCLGSASSKTPVSLCAAQAEMHVQCLR